MPVGIPDMGMVTTGLALAPHAIKHNCSMLRECKGGSLTIQNADAVTFVAVI